jgi:acyl carrier protein
MNEPKNSTSSVTECAAADKRSSLLQFVNEKLLAGSDAKISFDTPLFQDGRIDSLKLLQLIAFLDEQSDRAIPDQLITKDRFRTIGTIAENFLKS